MLSRSQKRVVIGTTALVAIVLFVVPFINVNRYRLSVAQGLSRAIGREVTVQGISIQTFPQPGLLLSGVVVADDPSISAEPMLRADEVLATLRFTSLWRGRLEVSNLKLKYPSLNLVRANDGRWNLESLLERARETPAAPTAKTRPESRPRFPYIQSDAGRINLKIGNEKKVFALSEADFALWLASEDEWRMRLEARPIRTDANLSDTGNLKMEGAWRRAPRLHETPIFIRFWWNYGQLGQITRLIYGRDRGWRGGVTASAEVSGQPEKLQLKLDAQLEDFRRYDIGTSDSVSIQTHCKGEYNFSTKQLGNIACQVPAGAGVVLVHGAYSFLPTETSDISVTAEGVPMQFLVQLARHAKKDLPNDLTATGSLMAKFSMQGDHEHALWSGEAQTSAIELRSTVLEKPLQIDATRWALTPPELQGGLKKSVRKGKAEVAALPPAPTQAVYLQPLAVTLGSGDAASARGWISAEGYRGQINGAADLARVLQLAKLAGLPVPGAPMEGAAKGELQLAGDWAGFGPATITGMAQLKNISVGIGGVSKPLKISSAQFEATPDWFALKKAATRIEGLHSNLDLSASWPQHCNASDRSSCEVQFKAAADQLNIDELNTLLNPKAQKQPWYAAFASSVMGQQRQSFPDIVARGEVTANKVLVKAATLTSFKCAAEVDRTGFRLKDISGDVFGGKYSGNLTAAFTDGPPQYLVKGMFDRIAMGNVAAAMKDSWATGTLSTRLEGQASGWTAESIVSSATGVAQLDWLNGSFPHVDIDGSGRPLQFQRLSGTLKVAEGTVTFTEGKLQSSKSIYLISGTANLQRQLKLKFSRDGAPELSISGTLAHPVVSSKGAETQAQLQPNR